MGFSAIFLLLSLSLSLSSLSFAGDTLMASAQQDLPEIVEVGVIIPATGDIASHGQDNSIGIQLGVTDFNNYLEEIGAAWRISLVLEDTQTDPIIALEKLQSLNSKGIKFILGPETSAELRNIKSYADSNNMLLISPSSTSPALAIDDNIFRLIPDDTQQGIVLAKLFEEQGIRAVVPVYRGDVWGDGLFESTKMNFEALGGVMDDGIRYSPDVTVYSTEANLLSNLVDEYTAEYSTDEVAVMLISFSEAVHILNFADSYDNLHEVRWFGSDASSHDSTLSDDPLSAAFTEDVNFVSTQFATSANDIHAHVRDYFIDFKGSTPNAYAYSSYDSVWVLGKTIMETNSVDSITVRDAIIDVAATHTGAIGTVNLNKAGDLAISNYDLWSINDGVWILYGHYDAGTGEFDYVDDSAPVTMTDDDRMLSSNIPEILKVGVLTAATGDLSTHGQDNSIGLQLALTDFNDYLEEIGTTWRMSLVLEDTQTDPIIALEKLQSLNSKGIQFVLGPETSAELRNIKPYADSNSMLLISPSSTSPALAFDDNIFRIIPTDTQQGSVLAKLLRDHDIQAVIPVYRGDVWGDGLYESVRMNFELLGGVMDDGIRYSPDVTVYSAEANLLSNLVDKYTAEYSTDKVAVILISFSEAVHLLNFVNSYDNLHDVQWFASAASSHDDVLSDDSTAALFLEDTNFVSTQFGTSTNDVYQHVTAHFIDVKGSTPNAYAYSSYDSVWVLGKTILDTNSVDPLVVGDSIQDVASAHIGAMGVINLDDAGDLARSNYDLWSIRGGEWVLYGNYDADTDVFEYMADSEPARVAADDVSGPVDVYDDDGGACLIATAAYGSELAPQVQLLREIRSETLMSTGVGSSFMAGFNQFYYTFSPVVADLQRNNVVFGDAVRTVITPGIYTLGAIMDMSDSTEESVLVFGMFYIAALIGLYIAGPVFVVFGAKRLIGKIHSGCQNNQLSEIES